MNINYKYIGSLFDINDMNGAKSFIKYVSEYIYNVNVIFMSDMESGMYGFYGDDDSIYIGLNNIDNPSLLISTFFHEYGHHYAILNNKWSTYHNLYDMDDLSTLSDTELLKLNRTALKAERWVDNIGKKEFNKFFTGDKNIIYCESYYTTEEINYLLDPIIIEMAERDIY